MTAFPRLRASLALIAGSAAIALGIALRFYPRAQGGGTPRLDVPWIGGALAVILATGFTAWLARPRRDALLLLGLTPPAGVLALLMPLLGWLEPAVRSELVPAGLETAGGLALVLAAVRYLQARADRAVPGVVLNPKKKVQVRRAGATKRVTVAAEALVRNDELALEPGEDIPVDGTIERGSGFVDESLLVGPSLPAAKKPGDALLAGSSATIPDLLLRVEAPFDAGLIVQREKLARAVLEDLLAPGRMGKTLAALSISLALAVAAFVILSVRLERLEDWLPPLAGLLIAAGTAGSVLALAGGRVATFARLRQAGLIISRAKDVLALRTVRRWQIDAKLLSAPGEVEAVPTADIPARELIRVAEALLSGEPGGPGPEYLSVAAEREKKKLEPAAGAALKKSDSIYHGTVNSVRWYMGPEGAISAQYPDAIDPTTLGTIGFLRDKKMITWMIGQPGEGVVGAIGIALAADPDAKEAAQALGATVMPGPADATRQALASAAGIRCDGPPLNRRSATLLGEGSEPPSTGLRIRIIPIRAPIELESERCPRLLRPSLPALGKLGRTLKTDSKRARSRAFLALLLPPAALTLAQWTGTLSPLTGTAIALITLRIALQPEGRGRFSHGADRGEHNRRP